MSSRSLEDRLTQVEQQVAKLVAAVKQGGHQNWLDRITGSAKDDPDFAEILRLGKEIRDAEEDIAEPN